MSQRQNNPRHTRIQQNHNQQHHQHQWTSSRLQDFLNNRNNYQLSRTDKHVCEFSQDREGSKFIQRKLDEATDQRKIKVFDEIHSNLHALMMHRFANFVVQKFFNIGTPDQRSKLYIHIQANFVELSLDKYGCRVVQKAIETATQHQFGCLLEQYTEQNVMCLVLNANGNHVIQNIFRTSTNAPNRYIQVKKNETFTNNQISNAHSLNSDSDFDSIFVFI